MGNQAVDGPHWITQYGEEEKYWKWKSVGSINCLVTHILQNILFCVQQKKEMNTGSGQLEGW